MRSGRSDTTEKYRTKTTLFGLFVALQALVNTFLDQKTDAKHVYANSKCDCDCKMLTTKANPKRNQSKSKKLRNLGKIIVFLAN